MVFSNNFFLLCFLPFFLTAYYFSPIRYRNTIALIASLFFYAWGAPKFIFILLGSLLFDYYIVKLIEASSNKQKKLFLGISVGINILLLAYFKYANFFIHELNALLISYNYQITWVKVALPIGISFITFHKLTYAIDTFRNIHKPLDSYSDYLLYIMMFPHQIAGPIVRYSEIADQIKSRNNEYHIDFIFLGAYRFVIGLSKKVLIANSLGEVANLVFNSSINDISTITAWIGILAYTFQIYFDFSGYSDMAIGLARMMGFIFPENFNMPYIAQNITEFWRRWHITLGRFMKDYLYIPLGGNKVSKIRNLFNLWIVFLVSGLWHGASWTFVFWGAYHGLLLIFDKLFLISIFKKIFKPIQVIITFILVIIGWVLFRAETIGYAFEYLKKLFIPVSNQLHPIETNLKFWVTLIFACIICFAPLFKFYEKIKNLMYANNSIVLKGFLILILLFLCIATVNSSGFNPFIYYRF